MPLATGVDEQQGHRPRALLLDGCECVARADRVPEDRPLSSNSEANRVTATRLLLPKRDSGRRVACCSRDAVEIRPQRHFVGSGQRQNIELSFFDSAGIV
jgi:hypothetical protein